MYVCIYNMYVWIICMLIYIAHINVCVFFFFCKILIVVDTLNELFRDISYNYLNKIEKTVPANNL